MARTRWVLARVRTLLAYPRTLLLYHRKDYLDAYREHTDRRVRRDPEDAVGETFVDGGRVQLDFLVGQGLLPSHRLLDIGCGTLRAGVHLIRYLEPGRYTGFDLSPAAIQHSRERVRAEGLTDKRPRLLVNTDLDLRFRPFEGEQFDILLAHSVFTHLRLEDIEECFAQVGEIMLPASLFFFTFLESSRPRRIGVKNFRYPFHVLDELAARHGLRAERIGDYGYPFQKMARVTIA